MTDELIIVKALQDEVQDYLKDKATPRRVHPTRLILTIALLIMIALAYLQSWKVHSYEYYLSQRLANMMSQLSSGILRSDATLTEVLEFRTINTEQAQVLHSAFTNIVIASQDIDTLGAQTGRLKSTGNVTATATSNIQYWIYLLSREMEDTRMITDEERLMLQSVKELTSQYSTVIKENVVGATTQGMKQEYWDSYLTTAIRKPYWKIVMQELAKVSSSTQGKLWR